MTYTISPSRLAAILAKARKQHTPTEVSISTNDIETLRAKQSGVTTDKYGAIIQYNLKQQEFISLAASHKSCVLIGAAGTGKTTCMKGTVASLIQSPLTKILTNHDHKHLLNDVPGIVICAYTRRATNNIRSNLDEGMKGNCLTIHKLLEYAPVYYPYITESGEEKTKLNFEPTRNAMNPLPAQITTIIFEESSMIGTSLYAEVIAALPHDVQVIFLGDIQQLPPVFGPAILGYKMLELPVIELTEVYRQALESPIIRLAHRILSGKVIPHKEASTEWTFPGQLKITCWKKKIDADGALEVTNKLFMKLYNAGDYNPDEDIILIPFNKSYGTLDLNKSLADAIAKKFNKVVWEVIAGFNKHYFSVGDKILYDREDAVILDIFPNPGYSGKSAQPESTYLDYWGHSSAPQILSSASIDEQDVDIDFILGQMGGSDEDRVAQSSHHIKILMQDSATEKVITKAAEVNAMILGYALTVHKAQGSEWNKVFLLLHNSHATMLQRELLYTAVTRAKKELFIICESDTFEKGIKSQRITGNTLEEKAEYFKGKIQNGDDQS